MNAATIPLRYAPTSSPCLSTAAIAVSVAAHAGVIALVWTLNLVAEPPQLTTLMAQIIAPAAPTPNLAPPQPSTAAPKPPSRPAAKPPKPAATAQRLALPSASESSAPPMAAPGEAPPAPDTGQTVAGAATNAPASAASTDGAASVSQPRFDADYLRNPAPAYPPLSRRLGEQGRVVLRVLVDHSGRPTHIEVKTSSGAPRLDQSAQDAVGRWQFVPARRGEQAVDAWVLVPIVFNLKS